MKRYIYIFAAISIYKYGKRKLTENGNLCLLAADGKMETANFQLFSANGKHVAANAPIYVRWHLRKPLYCMLHVDIEIFCPGLRIKKVPRFDHEP